MSLKDGTWASSDGRSTPVRAMNVFHLQGALRKLKAEEEMLRRIIDGEDPFGLRKMLHDSRINPWVPAWTPDELLERTTLWIQVIEEELANRQEAEIHGLSPT